MRRASDWLARATALALLCAAVACANACGGEEVASSGDADGADLDDLPALLPGAQLLASYTYPPIDGLSRVLVFQPSRDASRVVVPIRHGLTSTSQLVAHGTTTLLVSDDLGESFRVVDVDGAVAQRVHADGGRVFLITPRDADPARSGTATAADIDEVDLGSGTSMPRASLDVWPVDNGPGAIAGARWTSHALHVERFDTATGQARSFDVPIPAALPCDAALRTADGLVWRGVCRTRHEVCQLTADVASGAPLSVTCRPWSDWPAPWWAPWLDAVWAGRVWRLFMDIDGHTRAVPLGDAATAAAPVDLGPGAPTYPQQAPGAAVQLSFDARGFGYLPRAVAIVDGDVRVLSPARCPCVDTQACGCDLPRPPGRSASWSVRFPLDAGRMLSVGRVSWPTASDTHIVVRVSADDEEPAVAEPLSERLYASGLRESPAESALEAMCIRETACFPRESVSLCVTRWLRSTTGTPEADPALAGFLATPDTGCAAFRATDPALAVAADPGCASGCLGDVAVFACTPGGAVVDCARGGAACVEEAPGRPACVVDRVDAAVCGTCADDVAVSCPSALVRRETDCRALGLECTMSSNGPTCGADRSCTGSWCEGDVRVVCDRGSSRVTGRDDCARAGMRCDDDEGCVFPMDQAPACASFGGGRCEDADLLYCLGSHVRFVDCDTLGYATCLEHPTGAQTKVAACAP